MSRAVKKKADRIDLRVEDADKKVIELAASLKGMSVSSFTLSRALQSAREEISAYERLNLSSRDRDLFLAAIVNPPKANEALRSAMKAFKKKHR